MALFDFEPTLKIVGRLEGPKRTGRLAFSLPLKWTARGTVQCNVTVGTVGSDPHAPSWAQHHHCLPQVAVDLYSDTPYNALCRRAFKCEQSATATLIAPDRLPFHDFLLKPCFLAGNLFLDNVEFSRRAPPARIELLNYNESTCV